MTNECLLMEEIHFQAMEDESRISGIIKEEIVISYI